MPGACANGVNSAVDGMQAAARLSQPAEMLRTEVHRFAATIRKP
jgi:hypothetical protein